MSYHSKLASHSTADGTSCRSSNGTTHNPTQGPGIWISYRDKKSACPNFLRTPKVLTPAQTATHGVASGVPLTGGTRPGGQQEQGKKSHGGGIILQWNQDPSLSSSPPSCLPHSKQRKTLAKHHSSTCDLPARLCHGNCCPLAL